MHHFYEDEIVPLYEDAGWAAYTNDIPKLIHGFNNSLYVYGVYDHDQLVGLIRVVGDQETIIYIQDLIILSTHQRKGLASTLVKHVVSLYQDVRQIVLLTENNPSLISFYEGVQFAQVAKFQCVAFISTH